MIQNSFENVKEQVVCEFSNQYCLHYIQTLRLINVKNGFKPQSIDAQLMRILNDIKLQSKSLRNKQKNYNH